MSEFTFQGPIIIKQGTESALSSTVLESGRMAKVTDKGYLVCGDSNHAASALPKIPQVIYAAKSSLPSNIQNYATDAKEGTFLVVYE